VKVGVFFLLKTKKMSYKKQMSEWIKNHPDATIEEAWDAGYVTCINNWCNKKRN